MRIGIMTFHSAPNHGAALQAYALQTQLRKMRHDPFFINYQREYPPPAGLLGWIGRTPSNTLHKLGSQLNRKVFSRFQKDYLTVGREEYLDHIQLQNNPPAADAYICGSDQVWNPDFLALEKDERAYWLDFGCRGVRRIAYGASFGTPELPADICCRYGNYAKHVDAISVREKDAVELIKRIGRDDAVWVPDPTLLLDEAEYQHVEEQPDGSDKPYLFSYQLENQKAPLRVALQINATVSSELGLARYEAYSPSLVYNIIHRRFISPQRWLTRLRRSRYVVTNSFHGTVFSLLFHRPFIVLLRKGLFSSRNNRITSLLDIVGLRHRAIRGYDCAYIKKLILEKVDWNLSDAKIREFRDIGYRFLSDNLCSPS